MEASGVCTEPVYYALCEQDFTEVVVVNPAHAKALRGHKTRRTAPGWRGCSSAGCCVAGRTAPDRSGATPGKALGLLLRLAVRPRAHLVAFDHYRPPAEGTWHEYRPLHAE